MKHNQKKQGFTLPEVMITALVSVILMTGISRLAYTTVYSSRYSRDIGSAIAVGQEKLEELSELSYDNIDSGTATVDGFDLTWTMTTQSNAKVVVLDVEWKIINKDLSINLNAVYTD